MLINRHLFMFDIFLLKCLKEVQLMLNVIKKKKEHQGL